MPDDPNANPGDKGNAGGGETPTKYVTEEQLNKAITGKLGEFAKKQEASFKTLLGSFAGDIDKVLDAKLEGFRPQPDKGEPKPPKDSSSDPEVQGLKKQLQALAEESKRAKEERDQERAKARDVKLRQTLADTLVGKHGIDAARARHAVTLLVDGEKRARFDDDGETIIFKDSDGTEVDLATGLASWSKTDDAKIYMPPRGAAGSGDRGGGRRPNGANPKKEASLEDVGNMVLDAFGMGSGGR